MPRPLRLSVALCTWEGERHLPEQLVGLLDQERPPDQVVVVDDGSSDATVGLVEAYAATAPFPVHLEVRERRGGAVAAFEQALRACAGDVIALCDQDDRWYPTKLARLAEAVEGGATAAFSDGDLIGDAGQAIPGSLWAGVGFTPARRDAFADDPLAVVLGRSVVTGCAAAFRAEVVQAALPFPPVLGDERRPILHDRWLSMVAAATGRVAALPERLLAYRVHAGQATGVRSSGLRRAQVLMADARRPLDEVAGAADAAADQLAVLAERAGPGRAQERVVAAEGELRARAALPAARRRRIGPVRALVQDGCYARHASGRASAFADLLRPAGGARS